jgi:uncharacterized protein
MSKAPPEHVYPLRLARHGESLIGNVTLAQMARLAELLDEGAGRVDFELRFGRDDAGQACVLGHMVARLAVICQRCLEPMEMDVEREVRIALVRGNDEVATLDATYDPMLVGDEPVLLSGLIEDELILAMPNFSRHPRGECEMPEGADTVDFTDDSAGHGDSHMDDTAGEAGEGNPFSILESLKPRNTP